MELPCKICKNGIVEVQQVALKSGDVMVTCSACFAVYNTSMENILMATKMIKVSICDRPGCDAQFDAKDGKIFAAYMYNMVGEAESTTRKGKLVEWELCPSCSKEIGDFFQKRMSRTNNRWDKIYGKKEDPQMEFAVEPSSAEENTTKPEPEIIEDLAKDIAEIVEDSSDSDIVMEEEEEGKF